jgi:hypothetical protein
MAKADMPFTPPNVRFRGTADWTGLGTGIGSRWHADDRNHNLECCSGSPGQPVDLDQIGIGKAPVPAHVQHRGDPLQINVAFLNRQGAPRP